MVISNYITITFPTGLGLPTGEIPVLMKDYVDYPRWNPNDAKAVYGPINYPNIYIGLSPLPTGNLTPWQKDRINSVLPKDTGCSGTMPNKPMYFPVGT